MTSESKLRAALRELAFNYRQFNPYQNEERAYCAGRIENILATNPPDPIDPQVVERLREHIEWLASPADGSKTSRPYRGIEALSDDLIEVLSHVAPSAPQGPRFVVGCANSYRMADGEYGDCGKQKAHEGPCGPALVQPSSEVSEARERAIDGSDCPDCTHPADPHEPQRCTWGKNCVLRIVTDCRKPIRGSLCALNRRHDGECRTWDEQQTPTPS